MGDEGWTPGDAVRGETEILTTTLRGLLTMSPFDWAFWRLDLTWRRDEDGVTCSVSVHAPYQAWVYCWERLQGAAVVSFFIGDCAMRSGSVVGRGDTWFCVAPVGFFHPPLRDCTLCAVDREDHTAPRHANAAASESRPHVFPIRAAMRRNPYGNGRRGSGS